MSGEFALKIYTKTGENLYLYRGEFVEVPFNVNPEQYISDLMKSTGVNGLRHDYSTLEISFIPLKKEV